MARHRAKRANRPNPREDRNWDPTESGYTNKKNQRKQASNVIQLSIPAAPKKTRIDIVPRNLAQEDFLSAMNNPNTSIVFGVGPAGTGKTLLATIQAIKMLKSGEVEKVVISRPCVAVDDDGIGFLPGGINDKVAPWVMPILDVFGEYYTQVEIKAMLEEKIIEIVPIAFIRGRTFKQSFIVIDETQNTTPNSLLSILTRIGEGSQMVITGDVAQSDRSRATNGLADFLTRFDKQPVPGVEVVRFTAKDVERHQVIKGILGLYPEKDG